MQWAEVEGGLVDATPVLRGVIDQQTGAYIASNTDLVTEVHTSVADVAIGAYKAGIAAMAAATRIYDRSEYAEARLLFRADLAALDLYDRDRLTTHSAEVTALLDTTPSFVPFDPSKCTPEGGFTDEQREDWASLDESLIENFKVCDDNAWGAVAAEMGFRYGRHLQSEGVTGEELLNRVKAFEVKQGIIIRSSLTNDTLRQPDQDDHAYAHYVEQLSVACVPVWKALSIRR